MKKFKVSEEKLLKIIKAIFNNYSKEVFDANTYCQHIDFINHILENTVSVYAIPELSTREYYVVRVTMVQEDKSFKEKYILLNQYKKHIWGVIYDYRNV